MRYEGYQAALKKYNLPLNNKLVLDLDQTTFEKAKEKMRILMKGNIPFDGVFATNDWLALGALFAMKEKDVTVPHDVKLIGFDNISISKYSYPSITTINQDKTKLAEEASKALLNFINKKEIREKLHIVLPVKLVERETT